MNHEMHDEQVRTIFVSLVIGRFSFENIGQCSFGALPSINRGTQRQFSENIYSEDDLRS